MLNEIKQENLVDKRKRAYEVYGTDGAFSDEIYYDGVRFRIFMDSYLLDAIRGWTMRSDNRKRPIGLNPRMSYEEHLKVLDHEMGHHSDYGGDESLVRAYHGPHPSYNAP